MIFVIAIKKNWKVVIGLYLTGAASGITLIALGLKDLGPIGHILYKSSLEARFYYWQAAIRAFKDNFLFGVGLDALVIIMEDIELLKRWPGILSRQMPHIMSFLIMQLMVEYFS